MSLEALFDFIDEPILVLNRDGRIAYASGAVSAIADIDKRLLKKTPIESIVEGEGATIFRWLLSGRGDEMARFQSAFIDRSGSPRAVIFEAKQFGNGQLGVRVRDTAGMSLDEKNDLALTALSLESMKDMIVWIDEDANIVFANKSAREYFTRGGSDLLSRKIYEIDPSVDEHSWKEHWARVLDNRSFRFETTHKLGEVIVPVEVSTNLITYQGKLYTCSVFHDISERKRLEAQLETAHAHLEKLSLTDELSGLGNRRQFDARLKVEFERHSRSGAFLSLIVIDIDMFKAYNDAFGHLGGDECLRRVADALAKSVRLDDLVARFGGEEFVGLLPATGHDDALVVAERIRERVLALAIPHPSSPVAKIVTVSIGVATAEGANYSSPLGLVEAADRCLYEAKSRGRNCVVGETSMKIGDVGVA